MSTPSQPPASMSTTAMRSDGSFAVERIGLQHDFFGDLYHSLITVSWPGLLGLLAAMYFGINGVFAVLYALGGDSIANAEPGNLAQAFQFSVQTFATIGYGVFAPKSAWAHSLVSVEALVGIVYSAFATGLMFSKFARPSARVIFAERPVVSLIDGVPTLSIRLANGRTNQLFEASAKLRMSRMVTTPEGHSMRRFFDLRLTREQTPMLAMSWTLFHKIDAESPLLGLDPATLRAQEAMLILTISGTDETVVQDVHARKIYYADSLAWDHRYVDVIEPVPTGGIRIHYDRFHDVVPVDEAHAVLDLLHPERVK